MGVFLRINTMSSRLDTITDWEKRGRATGYSVSRLAEDCGVTDRTLRRYFLVAFGVGPHAWLNTLRQKDAFAALHEPKSVKEIATAVGYAFASSFSRTYKKFHQTPPSASR